jgi:hypothetical protein
MRKKKRLMIGLGGLDCGLTTEAPEIGSNLESNEERTVIDTERG